MQTHAWTHRLSFRLAGLLALASFASMAGAAEPEHQHAAASNAGGTGEPPAALLVDGPVPALLAQDVVVLPFRTENVKIMPVYGEAAAGVTPRIGHLHVTLDHAAWHWVHATPEPLIMQGLSKGRHQLTLELADANHHVLQTREVSFDIP
jgi:hypothetical protein